jgi:outer membrane protein assembly factor BamA
MDLDVRVDEAPALEAGAGLRVDTEQGWEGVVQMEHRNLGRGGNVGFVEALAGEERQIGVLELETPYLLPAGLVLRTRAYGLLEQPEQFVGGDAVGKGSMRRGGFDVFQLGKPFGRHAYVGAGVRREWIHVEPFDLTGVPGSDGDVASVTFEASYLLGSRRTQTGGGVDASLRAEWGGTAFGGDGPFSRYEVEVTGARTGVLRGRLGGHLDLGLHDRDVVEARRFRLGGPESLAGLRTDEIFASQRLSAGVYQETRLAGPVYARAGFDLGGAWDEPEAMRWDGLRGGWSLGLRVPLPLGPIALDYARAAGGRERWVFSVGYALPAPRG